VQTHALSKRGSVASLVSVGGMSISGSSASGGGLSVIGMSEVVGRGEHTTPTPASHVPMHGSAKAQLLDNMARAARPHTGPMMGTMSTPPNPNPVTNPEKNAVDVAKIEAGLDTRTTVMLKVMSPSPYYFCSLWETGRRLMRVGIIYRMSPTRCPAPSCSGLFGTLFLRALILCI
jgi:hypothetical protein